VVADAHNHGYVYELFERYLDDAETVPAEWQAYFASKGKKLAAAGLLSRRAANTRCCSLALSGSRPRCFIGVESGQEPANGRESFAQLRGADRRTDPVCPRPLGERDPADRPVSRLGAGEQLRPPVSRVEPILGEASLDHLIGDALHRLSGHSHHARDLRHAVRFVEDSAQHPPLRGRDAARPGEPSRDVHEPAVELERGDDQVGQRVARLRARRRFGPLLPWRDLGGGLGAGRSYAVPWLCMSAG
jgi:hypothetical protein